MVEEAELEIWVVEALHEVVALLEARSGIHPAAAELARPPWWTAKKEIRTLRVSLRTFPCQMSNMQHVLTVPN